MSIIWELIRFPFNLEKGLPGEHYLKNLHNPINDSIRFILFIFIPLTAYFTVKVFIHKKNFFFFMKVYF